MKSTPKVEDEDIKEAKATATKDDPEESGTDVTILDFAGQLLYHNTHSIFIRKENVIMLVFNASQPLSEKIRVRSSTSGPQSDAITNSQNIHFWMKTIHSICHEPGDDSDKATLLPVILLVATHIDLLGDSVERTKQVIIQTLFEELKEKPYAQHLAGHGEGLLNALRKYCIFISNKDRDPATIRRLQDTIIEISDPILSKEHPLVYLKIEKELLGIKKKVITTKEFHDITHRCGLLATIDSNEFAISLMYFHHCGTVLHFRSVDSLKDFIFLSPHWLTKLFSYILIAHPYKHIGGHYDRSFHILREKGILLGSFLSHMLKLFNNLEKVAAGFEVEQQQAVDLMKNFGFVAQISHLPRHMSITNENQMYIVPSLLPKKDLQQTPENLDDTVRTIYFYLPDNFLPPMLFYQMVAKCINRNEDKHEEILW